MNDREPPGYDDWFDDPEPPTLESGRGTRPSYDIPAETEEDVWVLPEDDEPRRPRRGAGRGDLVIGGRSLTSTQVAIIAVAALAVIVALIAAVMSGGTPASGPTINTQTTQPTTNTQTTGPTVKVPTHLLKSGDTGKDVKLLQRDLAQAGFSPGTIDGSFGPGTLAAVENFQNAKGLTPDGVAGKATLAALRKALGG